MPTLLIWGSRDAVMPCHHGGIANAAMPGSRLVAFDGAGHFPHHTDRERLLAVLNEFLANTEPASYSSGEWREVLRRGPPERHAAHVLTH